MKTISLSDLSKHPERVARGLKRSGKLRLRSPHGSMMLLDRKYYEAMALTIDMMMRPDWPALWARIEREFAEGPGQNLDDVVRELGLDRPARTARESTARRPAARGGAKSRRRPAGDRRRSA